MTNRETLRQVLASLKMRLILTYVLVTILSFGFLLLLLQRPVERFLLRREIDTLAWNAHTLGTTIRTPWRVDAATWAQDQFWTQRRSVDLAPVLDARIRLLDTAGRVLTDSTWGRQYPEWQAGRAPGTSVHTRREVRRALAGHDAIRLRVAEGQAGAPPTLYVAKPVLRRDATSGRDVVAFVMYLSKPVVGIREDLRQFRQLLLVGMIASLVLTVLVSVVLSGRVSARLRAATQVAQAFRAGQMDVRMAEAGADEVGMLGQAFNGLVEDLRRQEGLRRALLADVSHELRTPLTAIAGCADTLTEGAMRTDPDRTDRFLGIIVQECARLQRLVADILDLSKLQAGVVAMPRVPLVLASLVAEAVEIARLAPGEGPQICWEAPAADVWTLGHEDRLTQALRNLLDNACQHTPAEKHVTVTLDADEHEVRVHVTDQGPGIAADELPWIFDRFYRAPAGTSRDGTGLGLAIVREILHAHGGRIAVTSTLGDGTRFSLHLPRVQAAVVEGAGTAG
jgi:signal transduction histidine kinase